MIDTVPVGHFVDAQGRSAFRIFAPRARRLAVVLPDAGRRIALQRDGDGHWTGHAARLPAGTLYWLALDGRLLPDPASRRQPQGVHGPSMVVDVVPAGRPEGWVGVPMSQAIVYELHVGTFTPEGTLAAARSRLTHLQRLGVNVVELMPLAAFPGERNWGYDGTYPFALHAVYGDHDDLRRFIEAARALGMAVLLDVVYNHFGPEGHHSGAFAPYTRALETPWGAAINFDGEHSRGVRNFFLYNTRYWLQEVGFDGFRMDAVSLVFDGSPLPILREITDLAREIGRADGRGLLMIAEHLRNERHVTSTPGLGFDAQWNDDPGHAIAACLGGERRRQLASFGNFEDVVKALQQGFVLDGTRFDHHHRSFLGTDGRLTHPAQHLVYLQNHDQIGNRPQGDRFIATRGREKTLLAITALMASPFVPMLFMGDEYGEVAPFYFFEDFSDAALIEGVKAGRRADFAFGDAEPPDPHARSTFLASKLDWQRVDREDGRAMLAFWRQLIDLKRAGWIGPRDFAAVTVRADACKRLITLETAHTLTALNFSDRALAFGPVAGRVPVLCTAGSASEGVMAPFAAVVWAGPARAATLNP